jgi:hypothetical protein
MMDNLDGFQKLVSTRKRSRSRSRLVSTVETPNLRKLNRQKIHDGEVQTPTM